MHTQTRNYFSELPAINIGSTDRLLRFTSAAALVGQILWPRGLIDVEAYLTLLGSYLLFTALWGWEPLYQLSGFNTAAPQSGTTLPNSSVGATGLVGTSANQTNYQQPTDNSADQSNQAA